MAKQVDKGGFSGVGLSLIKLLCKKKKKKSSPYLWNVWSLLGYSYLLGKGKLKTHLHMLVICRASFEEECCITMPLFPVIGLRGESALQFPCWFVFSFCRIFFFLNIVFADFTLLTGR